MGRPALIRFQIAHLGVLLLSVPVPSSVLVSYLLRNHNTSCDQPCPYPPRASNVMVDNLNHVCYKMTIFLRCISELSTAVATNGESGQKNVAPKVHEAPEAKP